MSARGEPAYWTDDNQGPNVIRISPPPLRSGSMIPVPTFLPMIYDIVDNLVVFTYEDPNLEVTNEDSVIPVLLDWEDVLVYDTVQALASQEYPEQNIPVADACKQLVDLWTKLIVKNGE